MPGVPGINRDAVGRSQFHLSLNCSGGSDPREIRLSIFGGTADSTAEALVGDACVSLGELHRAASKGGKPKEVRLALQHSTDKQWNRELRKAKSVIAVRTAVAAALSGSPQSPERSARSALFSDPVSPIAFDASAVGAGDSVFASEELSAVGLDLADTSGESAEDRGTSRHPGTKHGGEGKRKVLRQRRRRGDSGNTSDSSATGQEVGYQVRRLQSANVAIAKDLVSPSASDTGGTSPGQVARNVRRLGELNRNMRRTAEPDSDATDATTDNEETSRRRANASGLLNSSCNAGQSDYETGVESEFDPNDSFLRNTDRLRQANKDLLTGVNTSTGNISVAGVALEDGDASLNASVDGSLNLSLDTLRAMEDLDRLDELNGSIQRVLDTTGGSDDDDAPRRRPPHRGTSRAEDSGSDDDMDLFAKMAQLDSDMRDMLR